jgi:hypothetical protein
MQIFMFRRSFWKSKLESYWTDTAAGVAASNRSTRIKPSEEEESLFMPVPPLPREEKNPEFSKQLNKASAGNKPSEKAEIKSGSQPLPSDGSFLSLLRWN